VAGADVAGVWVEDKRLSLVVHTRRASDPAAALEALAGPVGELGACLGFEVIAAATCSSCGCPASTRAGALARLAADREAVLYLGDDLGDLPAFAEIRRLRAVGRRAYSIGVRSSQVAELAATADAFVADPDAVVALLTELAG